MLLPKENSLGSLRDLYREVLDSIYDRPEIDALWKYSLEDKLSIKSDLKGLTEPVLTESNLNTIIPVLERLATGEPYQYIIGEVEFYGCKLNVDNACLYLGQKQKSCASWFYVRMTLLNLFQS